MSKISRLNETKINKFGSEIKIIKYNNSNDIDVYFPKYNWVSRNRQYTDFKTGKIQCPYEPRFYGVGYVGEGKYTFKTHRCIYDKWTSMIERCYNKKYQEKRPTYIGCAVCSEWHNFQNFAKWYEENYYEIEGEKMCLDKDILVKGNKIYSPETCIFVPQRINELFVKNNAIRGKYPIGISYHKTKEKLIVRCNVFDDNSISYTKSKQIGIFQINQIEEAFKLYKQYKEKTIKQMADKYKLYIPQKLYDAMYRYEVEIND